MKIDITQCGGLNPDASAAEAVRPALTSDFPGVATIIGAQFGRHPALIVEVHSLVNPADPPLRVVAYRLTADTLLFVSVYPDAAMDSPDVQTMLQSLDLNPEEAVVLPQHAPAAPLIDLPPTCPTPAS